METIRTTKADATRVFLACAPCKTRKRRCDGSTPKCSNCIGRGLECNYAAIRKTRGPGKRKKSTWDHSSWVPDHSNISSDISDDAICTTNSSTETPAARLLHVGIIAQNSIPELQDSSHRMSARYRNLQFPDFLLPGQFSTHLQTFRTIIASSITTRTFTPLMPLQISRRLIENSFTDIMAPQQIISQSHFLSLLEAQYVNSPLSPVGNPARWALVNTIIALAVRFKTAPGSQGAIADITRAFYQNATRVVPELILQESNLLSVQALLAMSLFAWTVKDLRAFVMFGTNASRLLELLSLTGLTPDLVSDLVEPEEYEMVLRTVNIFDKSIPGVLWDEAALYEVS